MQDLGCAHITSQRGGPTLPEDVVWQEANYADNERQQAWRQRRRLQSAARTVARAHREETPSEPESSGDDDVEEGEDEEEEEITPSPQSPPKNLPSLGDLFSQQAGISVGVRWTKCPWSGTRGSSSPPPQSSLMLVYYVLQGMSVCPNGDRNNSLI
jgi:hypothetical protein